MVDVSLSSRFRRLSGTGPVDPRAFFGYEDFQATDGWVDVPAGGFLLGMSLEEVFVPSDRLGVLFATSTYLRCGLVFGCGFVKPGWSGRLVLELGNMNRSRPLRLHVNDAVACLACVPAHDLQLYEGRYCRDNPMRPLT